MKEFADVLPVSLTERSGIVGHARGDVKNFCSKNATTRCGGGTSVDGGCAAGVESGCGVGTKVAQDVEQVWFLLVTKGNYVC